MDQEKEGKIKDLFESETRTGFLVNAWVDEGFVSLQVGFVTVTLPKEDWDDLVKIICERG